MKNLVQRFIQLNLLLKNIMKQKFLSGIWKYLMQILIVIIEDIIMIKFDYTNTNLDKCLTKLGQSNLIRNISIKPEIFVDYLDADIFNYESLLLIDYFNDVKLIADSLIQEGNKSDEIEFTLNKIHISDFIDKPKSKSSIIYLEYGLILLKQLMGH